jgi:hypothetical protein
MYLLLAIGETSTESFSLSLKEKVNMRQQGWMDGRSFIIKTYRTSLSTTLTSLFDAVFL